MHTRIVCLYQLGPTDWVNNGSIVLCLHVSEGARWLKGSVSNGTVKAVLSGDLLKW